MAQLVDAWRTVVPLRGDTDGPLPPALLVLTVVTGLVDAVSYLSLGHVFVANMTGNVVFVGFSLAGADGLSLGRSVAALAAFGAGSSLGGRIAVAAVGHRGRLLVSAVRIELALVGIATLLSGIARDDRDVTQYALVVLLGGALGLQNAAVRRLGVADMTTTVLTQSLTGIFADPTWLGGPGGRIGRRVVSVAVMLAGALVGAALLLHVSRTASLGAALVLLGAVTAAIGLMSRGTPTWATPLRGRGGPA